MCSRSRHERKGKARRVARVDRACRLTNRNATDTRNSTPRYNFRGRNFFTEFVCKELYGKIAIKVKELIKKFDHMSFTSDIWSDPSSDASLLSLTCHGIASDFERSSIILKCETFDDHHTAKTLKAGISGKFSTLLEEENSYIIATYLDPRYKNKFFTSLTEEKIKDDILKISRNTEDILASRTISPSTERAKKMKMTDSMDTDTERPGTSGTGRQSCLISDLAMILDSSSDDESQKTPEINSPDVILKKELLTFRNKKRINLNECPLKWWSVNQSEFKLLSKMERKFLSAPPASVPSEQLFSSAGLIYEPLRNRLESEKAAILLFIKYNAPIFKFNY
ncbi:Zinc finger BED domain-containing protein 4 [Eumeta japonica]|uniref:Zinc finger BED domain-containing protein 4 n=1 Tax=Eumeta variegata TaxID=151549 RepID=A0A4C1U0S4_EUMVA|nr:Zinc finger BED domain-containing protein 4 [Eumeta japonica]